MGKATSDLQVEIIIMPKVVYFEGNTVEEEQLKQRLHDVVVVVLPESLEAGKVPNEAKDAEVVSVFVDSRIDGKVLEELPKLKMIATRSTGYDHIDVEACRKRQIVVSNVPTYGEHTVAEHAFALILALSRKISQSYERTERRRFTREGLQGFDLFGKTLGVVGTGNIGHNAVTIGLGFGMKVVAHDVKPNPAFAKVVSSLGDFRYVDSLDELLSGSDVITLHVPYLKETHHLINRNNVQKVKRGAIVVNTARGAIVDTAALLWGLSEGIISGAGLDVLEEEGDMFDDLAVWSREIPAHKDIQTLLRNHILIARDDVIITPHNAFNSREAVQQIFDTSVNNIRAYLHGAASNIISR